MSNADLEKLQQLLRKEIQSHQILVAKMKNDPQNGELKNELHNQQMKITSLSEKQKKVVEQLRSNLGIKKEPDVVKEITTSPLSTSQNLNIPHRTHHKTHHHGSQRPVLFGGAQPPTPPRMSILTNKPSMVPIKVPNVASRLSATRALTLKESKDSNSNIYKRPMLAPKHSYSSSIENQQPLQRKALTPEEKKLEFMAALGLITQKTAEQLQSRRSERKRRSTANPQYSNFDRQDVESRRSASSFLAATNALGQEKRRRGNHHSDMENDRNGLNGAIQRKGSDLMEKGGQQWHSTVTVVNSYIQHKTSKEEEKKRLQKMASDLRNERLVLEDKAKQLNDAIAKQMIAKNTLMEHFRKTESAIAQLKDFITLFPPQ